ncbi:hypothetical protein C8J56DRAFT_886155 [Mycena floridula]|nr:hypothetical protein C8J56DRAFT_886155 [Mycena floridula]
MSQEMSLKGHVSVTTFFTVIVLLGPLSSLYSSKQYSKTGPVAAATVTKSAFVPTNMSRQSEQLLSDLDNLELTIYVTGSTIDQYIQTLEKLHISPSKHLLRPAAALRLVCLDRFNIGKPRAIIRCGRVSSAFNFRHFPDYPLQTSIRKPHEPEIPPSPLYFQPIIPRLSAFSEPSIAVSSCPMSPAPNGPMPAQSSANQWYTVTQGLMVGVYLGWNAVAPFLDCPNSEYSVHPTQALAIEYFRYHAERRCVKLLNISGTAYSKIRLDSAFVPETPPPPFADPPAYSAPTVIPARRSREPSDQSNPRAYLHEQSSITTMTLAATMPPESTSVQHQPRSRARARTHQPFRGIPNRGGGQGHGRGGAPGVNGRGNRDVEQDSQVRLQPGETGAVVAFGLGLADDATSIATTFDFNLRISSSSHGL